MTPNRDEGAYVLRFLGVVVLYLVASAVLGWLFTTWGAERTGELHLHPTGAKGGLFLEFSMVHAIVRGAFCLLTARAVGYHRRDALWAALPTVVAPYFAVKIAWRFVNLPNNRYWEDAPIVDNILV
jgi:hypothetical protein